MLRTMMVCVDWGRCHRLRHSRQRLDRGQLLLDRGRRSLLAVGGRGRLPTVPDIGRRHSEPEHGFPCRPQSDPVMHLAS
jgi:hypothetical protein